ncbi:MAG: 30S ribosomal protein S24e [Nanoarchaeota archaeon]|nr:30S ribosomal protein S24e [Nanoarchaeota archaeon]
MITVKEEVDNKAIGRKEIVFLAKHEGKPQPNRNELEKILKTKIKEKHFIIKKIKSQFGKTESQIIVHAYKDEKTMKYYEPEYLFKRTKQPETPKTEETKTPEPEKKEKEVEK